jgi:hypothetical protein
MVVVALVLARVLAEANAPAPQLSDEAVLVLKRHDIRVGNGCSAMPGDAGVGDGASADAGAPDAGAVDAGVGDGGMGDGGMGDGGSAGDAAVGDPCELIPGDAITLVIQPRFSQLTSGARFAILMVTPTRPIIEVTNQDVFTSLDAASQPYIEHVEKEIEDPAMGSVCSSYRDSGGCGGGPVGPESPYWEPPTFGSDAGPDDGNTGDADYTIDAVGPYDVLRANPTTTDQLKTLLEDRNYLVMPADLDAVAPYIAKGYTVVALRVALDHASDGQLSSIAITWRGNELRLPVALGTPTGSYPTIVYIAADHRYDLPGANVSFAYRFWDPDAPFLTKNELAFTPADVDHDPVAVQIAGDPEVRPITTVVDEVHVPVYDDAKCGCQSGDDGADAGCGCRAQRSQRFDWLICFGAIAFTLLPRRRRRR